MSHHDDDDHDCDGCYDDDIPSEEEIAFANCPYCEHEFCLYDLFPEPGVGGIEKHVCANCYNVFEVAEEIHLVYEIIESSNHLKHKH